METGKKLEGYLFIYSKINDNNNKNINIFTIKL
jgi:hypothetical protein